MSFNLAVLISSSIFYLLSLSSLLRIYSTSRSKSDIILFAILSLLSIIVLFPYFCYIYLRSFTIRFDNLTSFKHVVLIFSAFFFFPFFFSFSYYIFRYYYRNLFSSFLYCLNNSYCLGLFIFHFTRSLVSSKFISL